jgi:hypothetical protein
MLVGYIFDYVKIYFHIKPRNIIIIYFKMKGSHKIRSQKYSPVQEVHISETLEILILGSRSKRKYEATKRHPSAEETNFCI